VARFFVAVHIAYSIQHAALYSRQCFLPTTKTRRLIR